MAAQNAIRPTLRKAGMAIFARVNPGDIHVRHAWTGETIIVHSFKHKGYWFHRGNRERTSLIMSARLLAAGDHVIDVGGNIGYLSMFFAALVGPGGHVDVFEPDPANLRYLTENLSETPNAQIVRTALSDSIGETDLYVEELTGQNSSLVRDYQQFKINAARAGVEPKTHAVRVTTDTLDHLYLGADRVDFIKIDVEGAEWQVLQGGKAILQEFKPVIFIEVSLHHQEIVNFLGDLGYVLVEPEGGLSTMGDDLNNHFALHREAHSSIIRGLGLSV